MTRNLTKEGVLHTILHGPVPALGPGSIMQAMARLSAMIGCLIWLNSYAHAALPDDIAALAPGHWLEVSDTHLAPVLIPFDDIEGNPATVMSAWNSGAYDSKRNRLIVWGGGHSAYIGNEIYVFDVATAQWSRITDPSCSSLPCTPVQEPISVHSYDGLEYLPNVDRLFAAGGSTYPSGAPTPGTYLFDFVSLGWARMPNIPGTQWQMWNFNELTDYDPVSGKLLMRAMTDTADFDPVRRRWTRHGNKLPRRKLGQSGAFDFKLRKFVGVGMWFNESQKSPDGFGFIFDVDNNGAFGSQHDLNAKGPKTIQRCDAPGFDYDPARQVFIGYCGGGDVYSLHAHDRIWIRHPAAGGDIPIDPYSVPRRYNGTFGRWRYMPAYDAYILVTHVDRNVYIYKPASDIGTAGSTLTLSASPNPVDLNKCTNLTWTGSNVSNCLASGGWSGPRESGGNERSAPLSADTEFLLTCAGNQGDIQRHVTVTVNPPVSSRK